MIPHFLEQLYCGDTRQHVKTFEAEDCAGGRHVVPARHVFWQGVRIYNAEGWRAEDVHVDHINLPQPYHPAGEFPVNCVGFVV